MPARAIIKGREQVMKMVRTAQDPDAAEQRFRELEKMEKDAQETAAALSEREASVAKVEEEQRLKQKELDGRERHLWVEKDEFFKEQATKRHLMEKREHEAEDTLVKAADRQREADKRRAEADERENACKLAEANLRDRENAFAEQQKAAQKELADRAEKDAKALAERQRALDAALVAVDARTAELAVAKKVAEEKQRELDQKLSYFDTFRARF